MSIEYLFDSAGKWIAFKKDHYLFNRSARWIGWFHTEDIAVDTNGKYLGTVYSGNRLLVNVLQDKIADPRYPGYPEYPGLPSFPGFPGYCSYIPNTEDVNERRLD